MLPHVPLLLLAAAFSSDAFVVRHAPFTTLDNRAASLRSAEVASLSAASVASPKAGSDSHKEMLVNGLAFMSGVTDVACFGAADAGASSSTALSAAEALRRQVQRIIDRHLGVGTCKLPEVRTRLPENGRGSVAAKGAANVDRYRGERTPELCSLAAELYPRDVELWSRRCGRTSR